MPESFTSDDFRCPSSRVLCEITRVSQMYDISKMARHSYSYHFLSASAATKRMENLCVKNNVKILHTDPRLRLYLDRTYERRTIAPNNLTKSICNYRNERALYKWKTIVTPLGSKFERFLSAKRPWCWESNSSAIIWAVRKEIKLCDRTRMRVHLEVLVIFFNDAAIGQLLMTDRYTIDKLWCTAWPKSCLVRQQVSRLEWREVNRGRTHTSSLERAKYYHSC